MAGTYTIGTMAVLTGLTAHTIRAWERRYGGLSPERTDANRRLYGEDDVERLLLLKSVVQSGHSIGQVAHLPTNELKSLNSIGSLRCTPKPNDSVGGAEGYLASCLEAIRRIDPGQLENAFVRAAAALGIERLISDIVIPTLSAIDHGWSEGSISISQEHMASAVLRTYLERLRLSLPVASMAPLLILTTPREQHHEIGVLLVALVAAMQGWRVIYLGPNLPAEEIAETARRTGAAAIGLSIVYSIDGTGLSKELIMLRQVLGPTMPILVGGRAAQSLAETLESIGARVFANLAEFQAYLSAFVKPKSPAHVVKI